MKQQNEKREYIRPELIQIDMCVAFAQELDDNQSIEKNTDPSEGDDF